MKLFAQSLCTFTLTVTIAGKTHGSAEPRQCIFNGNSVFKNKSVLSLNIMNMYQIEHVSIKGFFK